MPKISEEILKATNILEASGIAKPRREAKSLLAFTIKQNQTFLIAHDDYILSETEEKSFRELISRRSNREPLQHITQKQEFYGLDFFVSKDVLIPRPETEIIVEKSLELLNANSSFCEVGVGSGCISVSILKNINTATAIGLDISEKALEIAKRNAETHEVLNRFDLMKSDIFEVLVDKKFDAIVSNPPYIPIDILSTLQPEVEKFEPQNALTDGGNGLSIIETLISESPKFLKPNGFLLIEIGFDQSEAVKSFAKTIPIWKSVEFIPDLQGHLRVAFLRL